MKPFTSMKTLPLLLGSLAAFNTQAGTLDPALQIAIADKHPSDKIKVIVHCTDPLNPARVAPENLVVSLKNKANACNRSLGNTDEEKTDLWVANAVAVTIPVSKLNGLKNKAGVDRITLNRTVKLTPPPQLSSIPGDPLVTYWNIDETRAPDLWALGVYGTGVVVATMDTGVDADHADIGPNWRGGDNSWYDPSGQHATPYDSNGHGTGVMGLIVGGNSGDYDLGVAPDAQWIAVKLFDDSDATTYEKIHLGFQWLLDPNGDGDSRDAPDIVNNSWVLLGTEDRCVGEFADDIAALKAAGIAVVFAAGNYGPSYYTSMDPANNAGSLSVGATDAYQDISLFSSRGPSACDRGIYPHIAAPGKDVLTAGLTYGGLYPNRYAYGSGTSYAAPHVAGAMALLMSAAPSASVADIETAIQNGAFDLGALGSDDDYGAGLLDVVETFYLLDGSAPPADADLDGVPDASDLCPGTPGGETVDPDGCSTSQLDSDDDGVSNLLDQCPGTPAGETVDADGCSASQRDSDDDGVSDALDQCPNTAAGETVDANGCAASQLDSDSDGVSDNLDLCPATPPGTAVDGDGCPLPVGPVDADGDGVPADQDCDDNDASVYPGAPEVKHDGIDQDCNGYDLTIEITKAVYLEATEKLVVRATSALGADAALKITFHGAGGESLIRLMGWNATLNLWKKVINGFATQFGFVPVSITLTGPEGTESAILQ